MATSSVFALNLNASEFSAKISEFKFDEIYDVIVIGSGISGHICATYLVKPQ